MSRLDLAETPVGTTDCPYISVGTAASYSQHNNSSHNSSSNSSGSSSGDTRGGYGGNENKRSKFDAIASEGPSGGAFFFGSRGESCDDSAVTIGLRQLGCDIGLFPDIFYFYLGTNRDGSGGNTHGGAAPNLFPPRCTGTDILLLLHFIFLCSSLHFPFFFTLFSFFLHFIFLCSSLHFLSLLVLLIS